MNKLRELLKELREYLMFIQCNDEIEIEFCNRIDAILSQPEAEHKKFPFVFECDICAEVERLRAQIAGMK